MSSPRLTVDDVLSLNPDLCKPWAVVVEWLAKNPRVKFFDPVRLANEPLDVPILNVIAALHVMAEAGAIKHVYGVKDPSGVIVEPYFDSIDDIPDRMRGRVFQWFETADCELVDGFFIGGEQQ